MFSQQVEVMEEKSVDLDIYVKWIIEKSQLPNMMHKSICLRAQNIVVFSHNTFLGLGNRSLDILSSSQVRRSVISCSCYICELETHNSRKK